MTPDRQAPPGSEAEPIRSVQVTSGSFLQLNRATGWLVTPRNCIGWIEVLSPGCPFYRLL